MRTPPAPASRSSKKILLLLVPALIAAQIAAFVFLHLANRRIALQSVDAALQAGADVFSYSRGIRREYRVLTSQLVAKDYGLLDAIGNGNRTTIESALMNQLERTGAELIVLTDNEQQLLARASSIGFFQERDPKTDADLARLVAQISDKSGNLMPLPAAEERLPLYAWVKTVVRAPVPIANMYLAYRISDEATAQFSKMTQLSMAYVSRERNPAGAPWVVHASTLPPDLLAGKSIENEVSADNSTITTPSGAAYRVKRMHMGGIAGHEVDVVVAKAFAPVLSPFIKLEGLFAVSIVLSAAVSIAAAYQIMRSVVNPLEGVAQEDALTGLSNRRFFEASLRHAHQNLRSRGAGFTVMLMDLNKFKQVNDTYGHEAGDTVLIAVAQRIRKLMRSTDTLARLGGDEFAVIMRTDDRARVTGVAQAIVHVVAEPIQLATGEWVEVGTSIGIAPASASAASGAEVVHAADLAMYAAKKGGGGFSFAAEDQAAEPAAAVA